MPQNKNKCPVRKSLMQKQGNGYFLFSLFLNRPCVLTSLEDDGYAKSIEYIKGQVVVPIPSTAVTTTRSPFTLYKEQQTVTLHAKIDLGGIAKGWIGKNGQHFTRNRDFFSYLLI
jgi:hypothetical protein